MIKRDIDIDNHLFRLSFHSSLVSKWKMYAKRSASSPFLIQHALRFKNVFSLSLSFQTTTFLQFYFSLVLRTTCFLCFSNWITLPQDKQDAKSKRFERIQSTKHGKKKSLSLSSCLCSCARLTLIQLERHLYSKLSFRRHCLPSSSTTDYTTTSIKEQKWIFMHSFLKRERIKND